MSVVAKTRQRDHRGTQPGLRRAPPTKSVGPGWDGTI
jgi:hypothetical protein